MKKVITISLLALIGLSNLVNAQVPNWAWAKSAGGTKDDYGRSVSTDASGNVFVTGHFDSKTIVFGTTTLTNANNSGNTNDIFIVKYNAAGNVLWAKSAGGIDGDQGYGVSTDASGNVFVTGHFNSATIAFGTTTLTNADNSGNTDDIVIVKYDANGNVLWAKLAGRTQDDYSYSVSTDAGGNVFMTGIFYSDTITFGTTSLTNAGPNYEDIFIVKYDASGNVLWAKSAGGTSDEGGFSVSTDAGGNVFMAGYFRSATIPFGSTTLTNAGGGVTDIFIAKLSGTTGIEEITNTSHFQLYPNPTTSSFTIQHSTHQKEELTIYNVLGEQVYKDIWHAAQTQQTIYVAHLPKGLYIVRIGDAVQKVVKE